MSKASVREMRAELKRQSALMVANARSAIEASAQELAASMRAKAPIKDGYLVKSIEAVEIGDAKWRVQAGGDLTNREVRAGSGVGYEREVKIGSGDTQGIAKMAGGAGVTYDYARAIEFGTVKEKAHPFFFNTYRAKKAGIKRKVKEAMTDALG